MHQPASSPESAPEPDTSVLLGRLAADYPSAAEAAVRHRAAMDELSRYAEAPEGGLDRAGSRISSVGQSFYDLMNILTKASKINGPWGSAPWGSEMRRIADEGYARTGRAVSAVVSRGLETLEALPPERRTAVMIDEVRQALDRLILYRRHGVIGAESDAAIHDYAGRLVFVEAPASPQATP